MRAYGYEVLVVSPDPVAFEANVFGPQAALAVRIARIERQALLQRLFFLSGWSACCRLECGDAAGTGAGAFAALMNVTILCYTMAFAIVVRLSSKLCGDVTDTGEDAK